MTQLHVVRVFLGPQGEGGNLLGVFVLGAEIAEDRRQSVAAELGYAETVFVEAIADGAARIRIFTPAQELAMAGHPTVGTSWLLRELGRGVDVLHVPAGEVATWTGDDLTWIRARPEWIHAIDLEQLDDPLEVERLTGPPAGATSWYPWAWIDRSAGVLRSRYFFTGAGIAEDEATGAAAIVVGARLGRPLTIRQGVGSELYVRPGPDGSVEVGGRVALEEVRDFG